MRQAIVLVVGLLLIAIWGVGLRIAIHGLGERTPDLIRSTAVVKQLPAIRVTPFNRTTTSDVVPASYSSFVPEYPTLIEVSEEHVAPQWIWERELLQGRNAVVWLRGSELRLKYESTLADVSSTPIEVELDGKTMPHGTFSAFDNEITCELDLDLTEYPSDVRIVLERQTNHFKLLVTSGGTEGIRVRRPSKSTLLPPTIVETRLSNHYPWTPAPVEQVNRDFLLGHNTTFGANLRVYGPTRQLLGVLVGIGASGTAKVLGTTEVAVNSVADLQLAELTIDTKKHSGKDFQLHYAAVEAAHVFSDQVVVATGKDNQNPGLGTTVSVNDENSTTHQYLTTNQRGKPILKSAISSLPDSAKGLIACKLFRNNQSISSAALVTEATVRFADASLVEGLNRVEARLFVGDDQLPKVTSTNAEIDVKSDGFRILSAGPDEFGAALGVSRIQIDFSHPIKSPSPLTSENFRLLYSETGQFAGEALPVNQTTITLEPSNKSSVTIAVGDVKRGYYQLTVFPLGLSDFYGNELTGSDGIRGGNYVKVFGGAAQLAAEAYPVIPGVSRGNAPMVEYPEFVQPRKVPTGFNPNDKVETRVARLYFYRDAHRVAQILNRRVQSYNRQEVAVRRQLADKARQEADSRTTNRMISERAAVEAAQRTRELENQLSDTQRSLNSTLQQLQLAAGQPAATDEAGRQRQQQILDQLQTTARSFAQQAETLESQVRSARDAEVAANERWQQTQREEELARTDQFRMETAAAHSDPDTFAAGVPTSDDPVAQVSISVIGEGLLHLRGPLKGVNQVRMMVDQIDSPQGQVRINVHSTQINGDEADELEVVANRIQTYIDQARFLTVQSAEMLRKAVIHVAATRAEEARGLYPGASQAERDQLYLNAFFGSDFVNELRSMDSELLHTGNKLLSLHSMDVTSLSSALMLLALANNGTRLEILDEFQRLVQYDLAVAEQQFIQNGIGACVGGCKKGCKHHQAGPPICNLAGNSTFTSLRGFFDSQLQNNHTMSPLQHETIGLAQILKARLITEMEYKQRVMERAVIEERTQGVENSQAQLVRERDAEEEVRKARIAQVNARSTVLPRVAKATAVIDEAEKLLQSANEAMVQLTLFVEAESRQEVNDASDYQTVLRNVKNRIESATVQRRENASRATSAQVKEAWIGVMSEGSGFSRSLYYSTERIGSKKSENDYIDIDTVTWVFVTQEERDPIFHTLNALRSALIGLRSTVQVIHGERSLAEQDVDNLINLIDEWQGEIRKVPPIKGKYPIATVSDIIKAIDFSLRLIERSVVFSEKARNIVAARDEFLLAFSRYGSAQSNSGIDQAAEIFRLWTRFTRATNRVYDQSDSQSQAKRPTDEWLRVASESLEAWIEAVSKLDAAQSIAQDARRPLDHKKFLDMLIDELEEKYIELLEGTRAHTSNIDNYLKRLTTSLDDDFNTQYYYPVFRLVREASQYKRVEFGQTETTNVLVNNRQLGKVSPSATMEFDLPKRDILIQEGLDSALAIYNDVGALVNDPNLLALAKMQSGGSVASPGAGTMGGMGAIRNVLPGLQSDSAEQLMAQNAGAGPQFESNVEKLIPDPAIYKFETGTGYEIRPVIAPDGQAVVFDFHYLYSTQVREPVRADEKHLGRVKQHFIDTDVQLSNFELREVSRYVVALKAERTANGVPLLEDIPVVGALWRPLPNREKSLQQNIIMAQATIFPTLFDLMGLRWAPAISDLDPLQLSNREYLVRGRHQYLENRIYDYSSARVDEFLRIPEDVRRADLYRSQQTILSVHPNGYRGQGLDYENSQMREGYDPEAAHVSPGYIPARSPEGAMYLPHQQQNPYDQMPQGAMTMEAIRTLELAPPSRSPNSTPAMSPSMSIPNQLPSPPPLQGDSSSRRQVDGWQYQRAN